jgi:uncharacterized protein involved in response to NO
MDTIPILPPRKKSGPPPGPPPGGFALFALGFRPFYLGAALFGAVAVGLWAAMFAGGWAAAPVLPPLLWHAHEMVFGFGAAVVTGFLFTAGRAWTGQPTPVGAPLAWLWALWIGARVAMWTGPLPLALGLDAAFLPLVALAFMRALRRAGNRRNYPLALALWLLALANLVSLVCLAFGNAAGALRACSMGVALVTLFVIVIGGRVIPMFTTNAIPGFRLTPQPAGHNWVIPLSALALVTLAAGLPGWWSAVPCLAAAAVLLSRVAGWRSYAVGKRPLLWSLHLAYAWLPLAFLLQACAALGWVTPGVATHAFTVGVIGGAIMAMITRTALGHTGRMLAAGRAETAAYGLLALAAALRVLGPLVWPAGYLHWVAGAAVCWVAGFLVYVAVYAPRLSRPRVDGKPG